jgi:hypothetical protein
MAKSVRKAADELHNELYHGWIYQGHYERRSTSRTVVVADENLPVEILAALQRLFNTFEGCMSRWEWDWWNVEDQDSEIRTEHEAPTIFHAEIEAIRWSISQLERLPIVARLLRPIVSNPHRFMSIGSGFLLPPQTLDFQESLPDEAQSPGPFKCSKAELLNALGYNKTYTAKLDEMVRTGELELHTDGKSNGQNPRGRGQGFVAKFADPEKHSEVRAKIMANRAAGK